MEVLRLELVVMFSCGYDFLTPEGVQIMLKVHILHLLLCCLVLLLCSLQLIDLLLQGNEFCLYFRGCEFVLSLGLGRQLVHLFLAKLVQADRADV